MEFRATKTIGAGCEINSLTISNFIFAFRIKLCYTRVKRYRL
jgi:hypothetical protein